MGEERDYPKESLLVSANWLAEHLDDPGIRIVDVRPGIPQFGIGYAWGHIPGAVSIDLMRVFSGRASGVPGSLGPPGEVSNILGSAGLAPGKTVIVYDDQGGPAAAQAFWLLDALGFPNVRLLEGGFSAWQLSNLPVSSEEVEVKAVEAPEKLDAKRLATLDWLLAHLDDPGVVLVDTRTEGEYAAGRLPGAILMPWEASLRPGRNPRFRGTTEIQRLFETAGITRDKVVVTYCQTGARSAHTYFTLRLLGYPDVRNYDGSWQEWGARIDTPKER